MMFKRTLIYIPHRHHIPSTSGWLYIYIDDIWSHAGYLYIGTSWQVEVVQLLVWRKGLAQASDWDDSQLGCQEGFTDVSHGQNPSKRAYTGIIRMI